MIQNKVFRLPSRLYALLYQEGGDDLLAVYTCLKVQREKKPYYKAFKSKNNKQVGGYSILRRETNLSLHTLQKHVPKLIELDLLQIHENGDVHLTGSEKLKDKYGNKLVPITVGKNMTSTRMGAFFVRLCSNEKSQNIQIGKKLLRREHIMHLSNPKTLKQYKRALKVSKKYGDKVEVNEAVVLSIYGYGKLKSDKTNQLGVGKYWKKKMKANNFIQTRRRFQRIVKMSYAEYRAARLSDSMDLTHTYVKGYVCKELISSIITNKQLLPLKPSCISCVS